MDAICRPQLMSSFAALDQSSSCFRLSDDSFTDLEYILAISDATKLDKIAFIVSCEESWDRSDEKKLWFTS